MQPELEFGFGYHLMAVAAVAVPVIGPYFGVVIISVVDSEAVVAVAVAATALVAVRVAVEYLGVVL